jgi:hypothetical protein
MAERLRRMTQAQAYLFQVYSCREICVGSIPALIIHIFLPFLRGFGTIKSFPASTFFESLLVHLGTIASNDLDMQPCPGTVSSSKVIGRR